MPVNCAANIVGILGAWWRAALPLLKAGGAVSAADGAGEVNSSRDRHAAHEAFGPLGS
jgi:hypothetical protein